MKKNMVILLVLIVLSSIMINIVISYTCKGVVNNKIINNLSQEEVQWIKNNKDKTLKIGVYLYSGTGYFIRDGKEYGFLVELVKQIKKDLDINLELKISKSWDEVYNWLQVGDIDLLYGANETIERQKIMSFTEPILSTPYVIVSRDDSSIKGIGDLDKKKVGFLENDIAQDELSKLYKNIRFDKVSFDIQEDGIKAVRDRYIDAYIITGGPTIYEYIYQYPELNNVFKIKKMTSDYTISALNYNKTLIGILNKEFINLEKYEFLSDITTKAEIDYNMKVMDLSDKEKKWLDKKEEVVIGITKDYLPFDYYINGKYGGINGRIIGAITNMTGIKFSYKYDDYDNLEKLLKKGEINLLNIAKTEEREKYVEFTQPYIKERDGIYGSKQSKDVVDVFGLEEKKVAVIKGFWHEELLRKNLSNVNIIETENIQQSMKLVDEGKVDYFIENPTVVKYYIDEYELYDIIQKGEVSVDSYLYFGISKDMPELATIINKVLPMIDVNELKLKGYQEVPHVKRDEKYRGLLILVIALSIILVFFVVYVIKLVRDLIVVKTEKELLKQREYLLSMDSLTEVHNRNYFTNKLLDVIDDLKYPQGYIVIDMNNLKHINDQYGHQSGDVVLKILAQILVKNVPDRNSIFRMGGDEFLIVLLETNEMEINMIIKNIRNEMENTTVNIGKNIKVNPFASIGYYIRYDKDISFTEAFHKADINMYIDKKQSKNHIENGS